MYNNIGEKIKTLASIVSIVGIAVCLIAGFLLISNDSFIGLLIMIAGPLFSVINSFFIYGFGILIENTTEIVEKLNSAKQTSETTDRIEKIKSLKEKGLITNEEYLEKIKHLWGVFYENQENNRHCSIT